MGRLPLLLAMLPVVGGLVWQAARERRAPPSADPVERAAPPAAPDRPPPPRALLAVDDLSLFPRLPPPGPSDWLAEHEEPGQSLAEFRESPRRQVTASRRTIRLQPLDDLRGLGVDPALLAQHLEAYYGLPVQTQAPQRPPDLLTRTNPRSQARQVLTRDVLRWLEGEITSDLVCVLALTVDDLYPEPSWNFVFGQASLRFGVGVFSFARMDPSFPGPRPDPVARPPEERQLVLRRCLKVVTHEVGHLLGLEHCIERLCLLNGSNHVGELDRAPLQLCPGCLRKVVHATRLDVESRYRALGAWYDRHGLAAEAEWIRSLLRRAAG